MKFSIFKADAPDAPVEDEDLKILKSLEPISFKVGFNKHEFLFDIIYPSKKKKQVEQESR
jgi:hypothetical protein